MHVWVSGPPKMPTAVGSGYLGRLQHYVVGKYLRDYYDGFLDYNVQEVDCLSSITFRSLYGAYAFLAGLYPSPPGGKLDEELSWQPVPCSFLPLNKDKYLQSLPNCAAAELDKSAMFRSKEAKEFMAPYRQLYKFWTKHSGLNVTSYGDAGSLYKTLLAEKTQNLSIPQWAEDTWNELELQSNVCYHFHFRTRLLHRLRAGERSRDTR
ncbi:prostatic acid phosphatase [Trichonephila clavipes]|nr:prostatic acid phosphatase [Trichonephila clavipes]